MSPPRRRTAVTEMLDARVRRALAPALDRAGAVLADAGVPPLALTGAGFAAGVGSCVAVGLHAWPAALALWLVNRTLDGLDGPVARRRGATELGGFLDIVADFAIYSGFIVALAVAVPAGRIACVALLCAYYVSGTAFLALSSLLERRGVGIDDAIDRTAGRYFDGRSLRFVGGLAEGAETVVVYVLFCLLPHHTTLIAWAFTAAVAVTAAQRVTLGVALLRDPTTEPITEPVTRSVTRQLAPAVAAPAAPRPDTAVAGGRAHSSDLASQEACQ